MDSYTIEADQVGVYEILLTAGNITVVNIANRYGLLFNRVQVGVHDASMPIYVKLGNTVAVKDPESSVVTSGTWMDLQTGYADSGAATIALISAADATVSVARA